MPETPEDIQARIDEEKERIAKAEERIAALMTQKAGAERVQVEDFEAMTAEERRELKEAAPRKYRQLQRARADRGMEKLAGTSPAGL